MSINQAIKVIELIGNWNTGQKSVSLAFSGIRTEEDDIYDERRRALKAAWKVIK